MADQVQELLEAPTEFAKNGIQFMRRCTKRKYSLPRLPPVIHCVSQSSICAFSIPQIRKLLTRPPFIADKSEYLRLCQAVGVGLIIMGSVGYLVKLGKLS